MIWNGLTYTLRLVRVDFAIVYRVISQRGFDPNARTPDGPRGILVVRVRWNTCSTRVYNGERYTIPMSTAGDIHGAQMCVTRAKTNLVTYEVAVIEHASARDNFLVGGSWRNSSLSCRDDL